MMKILGTALTVAMLGAGAASASVVTLTFDEGSTADGDVITSFSKGGITGTITAFNAPTGDINQAMIYDTANPTGLDTDINAPLFNHFDAAGLPSSTAKELRPGNVLVISQDGDSQNPNNNAEGGTITFSFDQAVNFLSFRVFDDVSNFFASTDTGKESRHVWMNYDNQYRRVATDDFLGVREVTFNFGSSAGAIDNLRFELAAVPVPATLPLLLAGVAGLGWAGRRRKG